MINYNYGTAMNTLIDYYREMLELIIQARLASDRVDEWKETLDLVTNPDQTNEEDKNASLFSTTPLVKKLNFYRDYL